MTRNLGAEIFIPTANEWYKAAYYDSSTASHFRYPTGSTKTTCSIPTSAVNAANCGNRVGDLTAVGSYANSASPYGTFDQGGNVGEWTETITGGTTRRFPGGSYLEESSALTAGGGPFGGNINGPQSESSLTGFRLARAVPEPGTGVLMTWGVIGLAANRSARRRALQGARRPGSRC